MADGMLDQVLGWLKGTPPNPKLSMDVAPPLPDYPSQHDADYARNYGFGDNNVNEDYLNNNKARVLGYTPLTQKGASRTSDLFVPVKAPDGADSEILTHPRTSKVLDLNQRPELQGNLNNVMMRAALAANRSPIASVGFDPSKVVVDSLIKNPSVGGYYRPNNDTMYSVLDPRDAIVHEATHRGLQKLRDVNPEAGRVMDKMPDEEYIVRWLMHSKAGDPEGKIEWADAEKKQRQDAIDLFGQPNNWISNVENIKNLNSLEEMAIEHMKGRGKRAGPQ